MFKFFKVSLKMFDNEPNPEGSTSDEGSATSELATHTDDSSSIEEKIIYGKQDNDSSTSNAQEDNSTTELTPEQRQTEYLKFKEQYKDLYGSEVESIIKSRFKKNMELENQFKQVNPLINLLTDKYGEKDPAKLTQILQQEYFESLADQKGWTKEEVQEFYTTKEENERLKSTFHEQQQQSHIEETIKGWNNQATEVEKVYPGFNFNEWTQNKDFVELLGAGISVKQAYELLDMENIKANIAKQAQSNVVSNIQARGKKLPENGTKPTTGITMKTSVADLTNKDLDEIERRVRMGERIVF